MGGLDDELEVKRYLGRLAEEHDNADKAVVFWQGVHRAVPQTRHKPSFVDSTSRWANGMMVDLLKQSLQSYSSDDIDGQIAILSEMVAIYR